MRLFLSTFSYLYKLKIITFITFLVLHPYLGEQEDRGGKHYVIVFLAM